MRFQDVLQLPAFDTSKATAGLLFAPQTHKVAGPVDHSLIKKKVRDIGKLWKKI